MTRNVRKFAISLTILTLYSIGSLKSSADPTSLPVDRTPEPPGVKLTKGKRAPFDGVLLPASTLAKLVTTLEARAKKLMAELVAAKRESKARISAATKVAEARLEETRKRVAACDADKIRVDVIYGKALRRCQSKSWLKSPTIWTMIGATVGAGACGLAVGLGK